jgi:hypothetical protein
MPLVGKGLSILWEAPQSALGIAMLGVEAARRRIKKIEVEGGRLVVESSGTGISLGYVVFWSRENSRWHDLDDRNRAHELGHTKQSRLFGPLYLPVIGVPSISRAIYAFGYREITGRQWTGYYEGYPENWADRLGGVVRDRERGLKTPPSAAESV